MVGKIKRWLGIEALERENLILAKAVKAHTDRLDAVERDVKDNLAALTDHEKHLTSEPARPKIEPKPKRTTWKQFRSAAEKANDLEEIT